jgi:hypothetical protein
MNFSLIYHGCSDILPLFLLYDRVQIESWGPFAEGKHNIFENEVLRSIAGTYQKTVGIEFKQTCLRMKKVLLSIPSPLHLMTRPPASKFWTAMLQTEAQDAAVVLELPEETDVLSPPQKAVRFVPSYRVSGRRH